MHRFSKNLFKVNGLNGYPAGKEAFSPLALSNVRMKLSNVGLRRVVLSCIDLRLAE